MFKLSLAIISLIMLMTKPFEQPLIKVTYFMTCYKDNLWAISENCIELFWRERSCKKKPNFYIFNFLLKLL